MRDRSHEPIRSHRGAILAFLWIMAASCTARTVVATVLRTAPTAVRQGIDPNIAPWWDLTLLPEIGPATAQAIVESRNENTGLTYGAPIDLTRVNGIGPRTIEQIGRYLRFDSEMSDSAMPARAPGNPDH